MKKILFILGESRYGAARANQRHLMGAFGALGHRVEMVDMMRVDHGPVILQQVLNAVETFQPNFIFTYGQLLDLEIAGRPFAEVIGRPHIAMISDHPAKHMDRLKAFNPLQGLYFLDEGHTTFARAMLNEPEFGLLETMPAGANLPDDGAVIDTSAEAFAARRDIDILFAGSMYDFEPYPWAKMPPIFRMIMDRALELAREHRVAVAHEMIDQASKEVLSPHGSTLPKDAYWAAGHVSEILNAERRWALMQLLAKAGLPVTVAGDGWARRQYRLKSFKFIGAVGADEMPALNARARIVINANRNFDAGAHDRLFSAMGNGAAVVSDYSRWLATNFTQDEELYLVDARTPGEMVKLIKFLHDNPTAAWQLGHMGQKAALTGHRWSHRARHILQGADTLLQQNKVRALAV